MVSRGSLLAGRVAWVTGGASGMGRAIAVALAEAGADVAIGALPDGKPVSDGAYAARPSGSQVDTALQQLRGIGARAFSAPLDVRDSESVNACHRAIVDALGPVDILVNAAGVSAQEPMISHRFSLWKDVLDINLNGPYRTTKACWPDMQARRFGRIINIASTAATVGFARHSAYCASKSGLLGLTRCAALEGAEHGISCNAINPGSVGTEMMRLGSERRIALGGQGTTIEENFRVVAEAMPQKRLVEAKEIAALAVFLCGEDAFGITGQAIAVSGGALW